MKLSNVFREHLLAIWANPFADRQATFIPMLVSQPMGNATGVNRCGLRLTPPVRGARYRFYSFGALELYRIGLQGKLRSGFWYVSTDIANVHLMSITVTTPEGLVIPAEYVLFQLCPDGTFAMAVKCGLKGYDPLVPEPVVVRFYTGSYFDTVDWTTATEGFRIKGEIVTDAGKLTAVQMFADSCQNKGGEVLHFVNGVLTHDINPNVAGIGDYVEARWDSSYVKEYDTAFDGIPVYLSGYEQSPRQKYLVHFAKREGNPVVYRDDVDWFVTKPVTPYGVRGRAYVSTERHDVLQLTHSDFGIDVPDIGPVQRAFNDNPGGMSDIRLVGYRKKTAERTALVPEVSRIAELYKLTDEQIVKNMVGTLANVPFWKAESLDRAGYIKLLEVSKGSEVVNEDIYAALGYCAASKVLCPTPIPVDGYPFVKLNGNSGETKTVFEYDSNGLLLGWAVTSQGDEYPVRNTECAFIEVMLGHGTEISDVLVDADDAIVPPIYHCEHVVVNRATGYILDVNGTSFVRRDVNGRVIWNGVDSDKFERRTYTDRGFFVREYLFDDIHQLSQIAIREFVRKPNGQRLEEIALIPSATVDVWLNGHSLVPNIDFRIDWPDICIVNRKWLSPETNTVTIRMSPARSMKAVPNSLVETGFVAAGELSRDGKTQVRDTHLTRTVVDGSVKSHIAGLFDEDGTVGSARNGAPYSVSPVIVPTRDTVNRDAYSLYIADSARDSTIEPILEAQRPSSNTNVLNPIEDRHALYSPFMHRLISHLADGSIEIEKYVSSATDVTGMIDAVVSFSGLVALDPSAAYDTRFVKCMARGTDEIVELSPLEYAVVERLNALYFDSAYDINLFVRITS